MNHKAQAEISFTFFTLLFMSLKYIQVVHVRNSFLCCSQYEVRETKMGAIKVSGNCNFAELQFSKPWLSLYRDRGQDYKRRNCGSGKRMSRTRVPFLQACHARLRFIARCPCYLLLHKNSF